MRTNGYKIPLKCKVGEKNGNAGLKDTESVCLGTLTSQSQLRQAAPGDTSTQIQPVAGFESPVLVLERLHCLLLVLQLTRL